VRNTRAQGKKWPPGLTPDARQKAGGSSSGTRSFRGPSTLASAARELFDGIAISDGLNEVPEFISKDLQEKNLGRPQDLEESFFLLNHELLLSRPKRPALFNQGHRLNRVLDLRLDDGTYTIQEGRTQVAEFSASCAELGENGGQVGSLFVCEFQLARDLSLEFALYALHQLLAGHLLGAPLRGQGRHARNEDTCE
jgi:hypothetical protein